ncbi:QRIC2 protein, partial [Amia calva]|nr:QRIC2 protein [Amia calva]
MAHVQNAILRLQADCEKLSNAASFLLRDERDKQKQLDHLSKSVEELDEKKADKERVQMEIDDKADKKALVSKVNWLQFEATTEQLNNMLQEVLNKMSGQNQDYQKTVEEISKCKLDRMELDPLKQQLEDQLKAFLKQHEERPTPEDNVDDAAGIKKQLVAGVHCISCDRAVEMVAPGSLKPGSNHTNYKLAKSEKNLVNTRSIHSVMCKEVERVQSYIKITESVPRKNFSQSRLPPLTGPVRKASDSVPRHKQISQVSECRYPSVSRSSGGSHTLANPVRRGTRLLPVSQTIQAKESKEIDTLDLEGRTYRGMNPRPPSKLPPISPNDSLSAAARTLVERPASLLSQRSQTTTVQLLLSQKTAGKR